MRSLFTVLCAASLAVSSASAQARKRASSDEAGQKELYAYVLSMDKIQKLSNATKGLNDLAKAHPEMKDEMKSDTLDGTVQQLQKHPEVVATLAKSGLTAREYATGIMTLLQASIAVGFKKSGTYKEYPPDMLKLVSKENLDFVDQHYDEIHKLTESMTQQ